MRPPKGRGCDGKRRHGTRDEALESIESLVTYLGALRESLNAYRCPHCHAWHVGHRPGTRGKR